MSKTAGAAASTAFMLPRRGRRLAGVQLHVDLEIPTRLALTAVRTFRLVG